MRTYPTPYRVCELCMDPLGPDQAMETAGYYAEDPEFATINAASGNARVARCGACRMLTTRIHGFRHAADPRAARGALLHHVPRAIAAVERRFAHARRRNPALAAVPSEIHAAALERMRANVLREVEGRLRERGEPLEEGGGAAVDGAEGVVPARTPDSAEVSLLLGQRGLPGSDTGSGSDTGGSTATPLSGESVGAQARLRWLLGQDTGSESGEGSSSGRRRGVMPTQVDERFTDARQIQFGDMPVSGTMRPSDLMLHHGTTRAWDAGDAGSSTQSDSPDRRLNTTPVEPRSDDPGDMNTLL